MTDQKLQKS